MSGSASGDHVAEPGRGSTTWSPRASKTGPMSTASPAGTSAMPFLGVRVLPSQSEHLARLAADGTSRSSVVRAALERYFAEEASQAS